MSSLHRRVALAAALALAGFVLVAGFALEQAFRESARAARGERLLGQVYLLLAAAEDEPQGIAFPQEMAEARFALPGSGLYAQVADQDGAALWRSPSTVGLDPPFDLRLAPGEQRFEMRAGADGKAFLVRGYGVRWATGGAPRNLTFSVAEDLQEFVLQVSRYRNTLFAWLGALSLVLLGLLWLVLRWGLQPLRGVAAEVDAVQGGRQDRLQGKYPEELQLLTESINVLLAQEDARRARLANALADLAHSLKTPLAVVHGALDDPRLEPAARQALEEQLQGMRRIIDYQLQRARTGSAGHHGAALAIGPAAQRVAASLAKVYRDKAVAVQVEAPHEAAFRGAEDDLLELLGNLLDNAFKWCRGRVRVTASVAGQRLILSIEDDGPGMDPELGGALLERGVRADQSMPGHGIGLAVVRDIAAAYGGDVAIERSAVLGGARIVLDLRA